MARNVATISFRLGGDDGVSVESRKWHWALRELGFETRRVAGEIEDAGEADDVVLPGLALDSREPVDDRALRDALAGADLVVVENLCSLPLNIDAAVAVSTTLEDQQPRVVLRHHDLPWQR